jgi:phosphatidylserine/phosphatidylglycerophosphate/cardiolipin synthase-like enzyme
MVPPSFREEEALLVSLLDEARARIDVQLLLYSPVQEGGYYAVLDNALRRAAGRGVAVRIIVSNWNLREPGLSHLKSLALVPGILVGISTIPEHSSGFIPFARVEHCKYLLVDNAKTWIATGNWSRDYFHASRNLAIVFEAEGISATVSKLFNRSWDSGYVELLDPGRSYSVPIVSGPEAEG